MQRPRMTQQIYLSLELDSEMVATFASADTDPETLDAFLDYLGDLDTPLRADRKELEAFLSQRQSHILGRADF